MKKHKKNHGNYLKIDFSNLIIKKENVLEICIEDLEDFYVATSDIDKTNLFFVLLASMHYYEEHGDAVRAAHLSYLTAFYIFTPLTPPGSEHLALHYINKALSLNPLLEYKEWLSIMEAGN